MGLKAGGYRGVWAGAQVKSTSPKSRECRPGLVAWNSQDKILPPHGVGWPKESLGLERERPLNTEFSGAAGRSFLPKCLKSLLHGHRGCELVEPETQRPL